MQRYYCHFGGMKWIKTNFLVLHVWLSIILLKLEDSLSFQLSVNVMRWLIIVFMHIEFISSMNSFINWIYIITEFIYISVCQVDMWNDFFDNAGILLILGKLKFETKSGKICPSYVDHIPTRNVKSALALVVRLLLEHSKVPEFLSVTKDSAMLQIKNTSKDDVFHSNSFGNCQHYLLIEPLSSCT